MRRWESRRYRRDWYHDSAHPQRAGIAHDHDMCEMLDYIDKLEKRVVKAGAK